MTRTQQRTASWMLAGITAASVSLGGCTIVSGGPGGDESAGNGLAADRLNASYIDEVRRNAPITTAAPADVAMPPPRPPAGQEITPPPLREPVTAGPLPAGVAPPPPAAAAGSSRPAADPAAANGAAAAVAGPAALQVEFPGRTTELDAAAQSQLNALAERLKQDGSRLQLIAYAGGSGQSLGEARRIALLRALAVRSFLINAGIDYDRLDVKAFGGEDPATANRVDLIRI